MNRTHFKAIANISLPHAITRAKAFRIPQAVIDLWVLNHRATAARQIH